MTSSAHIAMRDPERFATLAFLSLRGVGTVTCNNLRDSFGSLAEALAAGPAQYAEVLRKNAVDALDGADPRRGAEEIARYCEQHAVQLIFPGDADWPVRLNDLAGDRPQLIFVRGKLEPARRAIAVVGTRKATDDGLFAAQRFGKAFAHRGVVTVSGGASGIDTAAHQGALASGGPTWAVLAAGLAHMYPAENRPMFEQITEHGALITEFPPHHENKQGNFPRRNKLVAALGEALVMVEGDLNSGAMYTVHDAEQLRRPLFAVPNAVKRPQALAPHMLIRSGRAKFCAHSSDVLVPLGVLEQLEDLAPGPTPAYESVAALPGEEPLDPSLQPVLQSLGRSPRHLDELVAKVGWPAPQLLAALTQLELSGLCEQRPGKLFVRRSG